MYRIEILDELKLDEIYDVKIIAKILKNNNIPFDIIELEEKMVPKLTEKKRILGEDFQC